MVNVKILFKINDSLINEFSIIIEFDKLDFNRVEILIDRKVNSHLIHKMCSQFINEKSRSQIRISIVFALNYCVSLIFAPDNKLYYNYVKFCP